MCKETQPTQPDGGVNESLRSVCQRCQLLVCAKNEQMVFLRITVLVVDFLASNYEGSFVPDLTISIHSLHPNVMIGNQKDIHACFKSRTAKIGVDARAIRVGGMHVQINNQFIHSVG